MERGRLRTHKGAALAAALGVRAEHEVVHDQLVLAGEEVGQREGRTVGALELVFLVDQHHGQLAHLGRERVL